MRQHHFAARLRELREARGGSQQELAERAGLHVISVSRFENGTRNPTWETALALADVLGVECTAFCQEPTTPVEKRPRGRPRKDAGQVPAEEQRGKADVDTPSAEKPKGKG